MENGTTPWQWLMLVQHELLLFAGIFLLIGAIDEFGVDLCWIWLKLTGKVKPLQIGSAAAQRVELTGTAAIFIPVWQEAAIIGTTISHLLAAWPQRDLRLYVGCYQNDPATVRAVVAAGGADTRLRLVVHNRDGPTTKGDCLNCLYRALEADEVREGFTAHMIVLHDAEDMVDPAALTLMDICLASGSAGSGVNNDVGLVQIPVRPEPQAASPWVAGHYCEEFAEAHAKNMVVRDALGAGLPSAGVGCAISRPALALVAQWRGQDVPFAADCLTEDYELGLGIADLGLKTRFLRVHDSDGRLVATRACFPNRLDLAVRQKARWVHGIALQGWDRIGWGTGIANHWMRLRDRKGPLTALILACGYLLVILYGVSWIASRFGGAAEFTISPVLKIILLLNLASFIWRAMFRFGFTYNEYGLTEAVRSVIRIPHANIIAIMAGRRAMWAYMRSLTGQAIYWDKTDHDAHPASATMQQPDNLVAAGNL